MTLPSDADERQRSWLDLMERLRVLLRDDYEVLALLGYGGMAGVFLAVERRLRRRVALKVMSPELMIGHNMIDRFHQEAVTQANLEHPNIAAVHAVREQGGLHFFAMQYVGGRTLQAALRFEVSQQRALDFGVVTTLLHQVGSALEYAHSQGVIHRDVKPGNVLLSGEPRAVVTDFGIAKVTEGPALTAVSMVQGTASYMSPEQCYASELSGASDQYSLGILAYELVAGRVPFVGDTFSIMQAHAGREPERLETHRPDTPPALADAIHRMIAKAAGDRFPTIAAALDAMGAHGLSPRRDDPVRLELVRLAATDEVMRNLSDDVRRAMLTPRSSESIALTSDRGTSQPARSPTPTVPMGAVIQRVAISPHPVVVALGEQLRLDASCTDREGRPVPSAITWATESSDILELSAAGDAIARQWGRARVRATAGTATADTELIVGTVPIARVEIHDLPATLIVGASAPFRVRVLDVGGRERAIPAQSTPSDPSVLQLETLSSVRAVAAGRSRLVVRCGSAEASQELAVVPRA